MFLAPITLLIGVGACDKPIREGTRKLIMKSETNTNLAVEFKEKDQVKALGARWRPEEKVWYVHAGLDLKPFARWLPNDPGFKSGAEQAESSPSPQVATKPAPSRERRRKLYDPTNFEPFAVSRTKIDLFVECPRCFYLDRRLGIGRPSGPPFLLNSAVRGFPEPHDQGRPVSAGVRTKSCGSRTAG